MSDKKQISIDQLIKLKADLQAKADSFAEQVQPIYQALSLKWNTKHKPHIPSVEEIKTEIKRHIERLSLECVRSESGRIGAGYKYPYDAEVQAIHAYLKFSIGIDEYYI